MIVVLTGLAALVAGAFLCYCSHPNQRLGDRPLAPPWRRVGGLLLGAGCGAWVLQAGWRTGPLVVAMLLMLLFGALPLLTLMRRRAS